MKVRIGFGLGAAASVGAAGRFGELVDGLEALRFDSLWLSERLTGDAPDPLIGLAVAAGRTTRLKLGTSVLVVPGRNPVVLAKELASLDVLSGGRLLPAVGLGAVRPAEQAAFGVERGERAAWLEEALPLLRELWTGEPVTHEGPRFRLDGVQIGPRPIGTMDVWFGGQARSELRRTGRLGDGWLPSFCTPADVAEGWEVITETAAEHDRTIDPEHLGALVVFANSEVPEGVAALIAQRRPELEPGDIVPIGLDGLRAQLEKFIAAGASKFVLVPADEPPEWEPALRDLTDAVFDLQT
ncbi:MAG TPA: LLM class flavin-dependent oxidoreductase [Acidimicrobiales bacterium]|nr:LLM class flavin-dependent oxidoreductase [Acidimicrobiales bacterium]